MTQPHVVTICSSLRDRSYTRLALEHVPTGTSAAGGITELVDLCEYNPSLFDVDFDEQGGSIELTRVVDDTDVVIPGMPVRYGSYSGTLRNVPDYCDFDEFGEKTVGLLTIAGESFPVTTLEHL